MTRPRGSGAPAGRLPAVLAVLAVLPILFFAETAFALEDAPTRALSLAARIEKAPDAPESLADFFRLRDLQPFLTAENRMDGLCHALDTHPRTSLDLRLAARWCLWDAARRSGDPAATETLRERLGLLTRWRSLGPFDNEGGSGMEHALPPEDAYDPGALYPGKARPVSWRVFPPINELSGYQNFQRVHEPGRQSLGYAYARVHSPKRREAVLILGGAGSLRVWVNGRYAGGWDGDRNNRRFQNAYVVRLERGVNDIVVKSGGQSRGWGFRLALLNRNGEPFADLTGLSHGRPADRLAPFPESRTDWKLSETAGERPLPLSVERLEKRMESRPDVRTALDLSRLLHRLRPFKAEEKRHEHFAERALELDPGDPEALLWCGALMENHNRRLGCLTEGRKRHPDEPRFALHLAGLLRREGRFLAARDLLESIRNVSALEARTARARASLLNRRDWSAEALLILRDAYKRHPVPYLEEALVNQYDRLEYRREARRLRLDMLKRAPGDLQSLRWLAADAEDRRDIAAAIDYLDRITALSPDEFGERLRKVRLLEGLDRTDAAREILEHLLSMAPEETLFLDRLADLEHRSGHTEQALALWNKSLEIMPQNPDLKKYLALLQPESRGFEVDFVQDAETVVQRMPPQAESGESAEYLLDQTVHKVFENGLSSQFRQQILRVLDPTGADSFRTFGVRYYPGRQEVTVLRARILRPDGSVNERHLENDRSGSRSYKLYHDYSIRLVTFPDLKPGDVAEVQYRVDDIASENLFADYFGAIQLFQDYTVARERRFVVLMPEGRELYANRPALCPEPEITQTAHGRRYAWRATDIPKLRREPKSPPLVEIADYIHVSTFKDWNAMGAWYWGLIREQFAVKEALKAKVRELIDGVDDPLQRLIRIHRWVVTKTRYVGLEFGVHSFKPYPVNQIFDRKFGDCKDKATLLVAMLKEAGIRARMAIIRTSNVGALQEYPPSLAMFNHAIAYLPEYDLYLDGTAEFSGSGELPYQDRRGQVMLVGPEGTEFTRVPAADPKGNVYREDARVRFDKDGAAEVVSEVRVTGSLASNFRAHFQDSDRRKEYLEKLINKDLPGAKLRTFSFRNIENIRDDVELDYQVLAPGALRDTKDGTAFRPALDRVNLVKEYASLSERDYPVAVTRLQTLEKTIVFDLGDAVSVRDAPKDVHLETPFAAFTRTLQQNGTELRVRTRLQFRKNRIGVKEYDDFRTFCQDVTRAFNEEVHLVPNSSI